jgi:hypothetical protein
MTADDAALSPHPAPHRRRVTAFESVFGLIAGPLAWAAQLDLNYALASRWCFPKDERALLPLAASDWTWPAMIIGMLAAVSIGLAALLVSWRAYRATRAEQTGGVRELMDVGSGRTRFLALWGVLLGSGFALASGLTAVAFIVLPRCAA